MKYFEKRDEAMKWYFLHSSGQEEQFKLNFTPLPRVFETPPFYYTPPVNRLGRVGRHVDVTG